MKKYILAFSILLVSSLASGQILEMPVSFDTNGKIMEWGAKLEAQARLFPETEGYQNAAIWKSDSLYLLEILTEQGRLRKTLTLSGLDSMRMRVDAFFSRQDKTFNLNQEGRGAYLLWQIPLSLGWYGPAVLGIVQPKEATTGVGLYLASASASYFVPFIITNNKQVTSGQEHLSIACGFRGITVGGAISNIFDMQDSKAYFATMLATSISGQVAGYHYGRYFTKPQARMISNYATLGMVEVPLASVLFKTDYGTEKSFLRAQSIYLLTGLAGGGYLGYKLANNKYRSEGQPSIIATAGWTGLLAGTGAYFFLRGPYDGSSFEFSSGEAKIATLMALCTSVSGLCLAHKYTRGYTFTRGDGYIVMGSTAGGALLGCGLGFLMHPTGESESNEVFQSVSGLSSLGMMAGYALGIYSVRKQNNKRLGNLEINFDGVPLGLAMVACKAKTQIPWITAKF